MPTIPAFMLTETVTIEAYGGETGTSGPKYAAPVSVKAHVEPRRQLVIKRESREIRAEMLLIVAPGTVVPPESRVTYGGRTYRVVNTAEMPSPGGGVHHLEVALA